MIPPSDFDTDPSVSPFEVLNWSEVWTKALISPSVDTYTRIAYDPQAGMWRAATWIFAATLVGMFISAPIALLFNPAPLDQLGELLGQDASSLVGIAGLLVCLVPLGALFSVIGAMVSAAIYQLIAGMLGGRGNFDAMFTAFAAFGAPLGLISSIFSAIPIVNLCVALPLALYGFVLSVIAVQAVNRFGTGKAIATMLIPSLVYGLCCCLAAFALSSALAPLIGDPANLRQLLTPVP